MDYEKRVLKIDIDNLDNCYNSILKGMDYILEIDELDEQYQRLAEIAEDIKELKEKRKKELEKIIENECDPFNIEKQKQAEITDKIYQN